MLGLRWFLFLDNISPDFEKTLSQGTKYAGEHGQVTANLYRFGYCVLQRFQYTSGSSVLGMLTSAR